MIRKREKLLDKIIKKDYKNELEEVLANKPYEEDVKNLLQDLMYKIDNAYEDYKTVKINVLSKEKYMQNIIETVRKCNSIKFIAPNYGDNGDTKSFYVDYENKEIKCFPIERKILYALSKFRKTDDIVKTEGELLNRTLTNLLNVGNNINTIEPLRDFNGFSWNVSVLEIENLYYNLIYQDLIILIGNNFLEEWTNKNECIIDYMALFQGELEKRYGRKITKNVLDLIKKLSVLLELTTNQGIREELEHKKEEVEEQLEDMENREEYLEQICKQKKRFEKQIRKIDLMINDKHLLQEEYKKRNKKLPISEKIFSTRILAIKLREEREEKVKKLKELNLLMNPKNFIKSHMKLKTEYEYLKLIEVQNVDEEILENIISLQKEVLRSLKIKISKAKNKSELMKTIYEFRYLYLVPITVDKKIGEIPKLTRIQNSLIKEILKKSSELKIISKVFKEESKDIEILRQMFSLHIISLEDIYSKITKASDVFYIQFYDENIEDERFIINLELKKEDFNVRLGKKVKLFI